MECIHAETLGQALSANRLQAKAEIAQPVKALNAPQAYTPADAHLAWERTLAVLQRKSSSIPHLD
ncbi:MAG: hypothetical protein R3E79_16145 [Caldilineaceae bacterium]